MIFYCHFFTKILFNPQLLQHTATKENTGGRAQKHTGANAPSVVFFSKGSYFNHRPNLLQLVIEPVLFTKFDICGRLWGKIGAIGKIQPELISQLKHTGQTHSPRHHIPTQNRKHTLVPRFSAFVNFFVCYHSYESDYYNIAALLLLSQ
jgi:hypothetical protein